MRLIRAFTLADVVAVWNCSNSNGDLGAQAVDTKRSWIMRASLALAMSTLAHSPAAIASEAGAAELASTTAATAPKPAATSMPKAPLVSPAFAVPTSAEGPGFKLVPLGPDLAKIDFDAYMSSIEHLQKTFSRSTSWPREGISAADAVRDMQSEQARFNSRKSFAYAVLTPDGRRERGCVYVSPSPVAGYDAVVRLWVTKADYDAGFDAQLYQWATRWIQKDWPFKKVAYPGRAITWSSWDASVAASKAAAPGA